MISEKKIIRVFPRRTNLTPNDDLVFIGLPRFDNLMVNPEEYQVHISVTFSWDVKDAYDLYPAWRQYFNEVLIGGPAVDKTPPGMSFPDRYVRKGVIFTSRGCNNQCPWCLAWKREGKLKEIGYYEGNLINDNNILQCSHDHVSQVISMLKHQPYRVFFPGGLDLDLVDDWFIDQVRDLNIRQMFFACDTKHDIKKLERVANLTKHFDRRQKRCYALLAFGNEKISDAQERLKAIFDHGFLPYPQLYQPDDKLIKYSKDWQEIMREWCRGELVGKKLKHERRKRGNRTDQNNTDGN